jgi:virginiamycin B lyase
MFTRSLGVAAGILVSLSAQANSSSLPEGAGKPLVENLCQSCHKVENVHRSLGYAEEEWRALIGTMIDLEGTQELGTIAAYLSKHFPKDVNRQAVLVDGKAQVEFREWVVPTPGQRSRDPIEAPDGKIWWAGQWADLVGSIDPKTNEMNSEPADRNSIGG